MGTNGQDDSKILHGEWALPDRVLQGPSSRQDAGMAEQDKDVARSHYDALNRLLDEQVFGRFAYFLNWGYVPNERPSFAVRVPGKNDFDVNSRRLVLEVLGDAPVDGHDLLDVSCGRGSVAVVLHDYYGPRSYTGVDLSAEGVAFCRIRHTYENYSFCVCDAEELPFEDESFDILTNIEASHNYPQVYRFFDECHRVLRPGGWFLYTDVLSPGAFTRHNEMLEGRGWVNIRDVDISANVRLSCDEMGARRMKIYKDPEKRRFVEDFLGLPGSKTYNGLRDGLLQYRLQAWRKPSGNEETGR